MKDRLDAEISVREAYDLWALTYDKVVNPTRDLDGVLLRRDLAGVELGRVLELGCGTGKNTQWLVEHGPVTGLDFSVEMLAACKRAAPGATLMRADLNRSWPVDDACFDTILFDLVLEHVDVLHHIAGESARAVCSGGRVRMCELHPRRQVAGSGARFDYQGQVIYPEAFLHSREDYLEAFTGAGFVLTSAVDAHAPSDPSDAAPRLLTLNFVMPDTPLKAP